MKTMLVLAAVAAAALVLLVAPAGAQQPQIVCPAGSGCLQQQLQVNPAVPTAYSSAGNGGYYGSRSIGRVHDTIGVVQRLIWLPAEVAGAIKTAEGIWRLPPPQYPQPPYPGGR